MGEEIREDEGGEVKVCPSQGNFADSTLVLGGGLVYHECDETTTYTFGIFFGPGETKRQ